MTNETYACEVWNYARAEVDRLEKHYFRLLRATLLNYAQVRHGVSPGSDTGEERRGGKDLSHRMLCTAAATKIPVEGSTSKG